MTVQVRQAMEEDLARVARVTLEAYQEFAQSLTLENWNKMRALLDTVPELARIGTLLVAVEGNEILGSVIYCPPGKSDIGFFPNEWATIRLLAVRPTCRGKGVGLLLTQRCIELGREDKAPAIGLHTSDIMPTARRLYDRLGFRQEKELPVRYGVRYWLYQKPLC
jgi:ribosomal protein S18 acetylase RimI-like enzyme